MIFSLLVKVNQIRLNMTAKFVNWDVKPQSKQNKGQSDSCKTLMGEFLVVCRELGVHIAQEKTDGPSACLVFLGYLLDTLQLQIYIPDDKIQQLLE